MKDSFEKKLKQLGHWHFLVELEPGVFTIPRDQWRTHWHTIVTQDYMTRTLFPLIGLLNKKSPQDTTLIDIGCNEGWISLIAHRLGFKRILGVDPNPANIKKANFLKEYFGMRNVEFQIADINDFKIKEKFDFSIMLGVINHTHNPVRILQNIQFFTDEYLILDTDALCEDYIETSKEAKFDADISSVAGNMRCHFEHAHQTTSLNEGDLVFQYSRRALQLMMNYSGFDAILQVPPSIFAPAHYKNDRRVMLAGHKNSSENFCAYALALDKEHMEAKSSLDFPQPKFEESYKRYNIVSCGGDYYGVPHGEMECFDVVNVINNTKCAFGSSILTVRERIDENSSAGQEIFPCDLERDKLKCKIARELILQSKLEEAKKMLEDLGKRHNSPVTELTVEVSYNLGCIAKRAGDISRAKGRWEHCLAADPDFAKARTRLWEAEHDAAPVACHKIFS